MNTSSSDPCWFVYKHLDRLSFWGLLLNPRLTSECLKFILANHPNRHPHPGETDDHHFKTIFHTLSRNTNLPLDFMEEFIGAPFNWQNVSRYHQHLTLEFILDHKNMDWDIGCLVKKKNIDYIQILKAFRCQLHPDLVYNDSLDPYTAEQLADNYALRTALASTHKCSLSFLVERFYDKWPWLIESDHPDLTPHFVLFHREFHLNWRSISRHPNFGLEAYKKYKDYWPWDHDSMLENPSISPVQLYYSLFPLEYHKYKILATLMLALVFLVGIYSTFVTDIAHLTALSITFFVLIISIMYVFTCNEFSKLDVSRASYNTGLTPELVNANPWFPWDWRVISRAEWLTSEFIVKNRHKPWNWNDLSANTRIPQDLVISHPDFPFNWKHLSNNRALTLQTIQSVPIPMLEFSDLSENPNLSPSFIDNHMDQDWETFFLSQNPSIIEPPSLSIKKAMTT